MANDNGTSKFNLPGGENTNAGRGRPAGSVNIASRRASKKLEQLGFDPIEEMVRMYHNINFEIECMKTDSNGEPTKKFSQMTMANLLATRQRCITELMRYGYARVTEGVEVTTQALAPVTIQLAGSPVDFDTGVLGVKRDEEDDNVSFKGVDE